MVKYWLWMVKLLALDGEVLALDDEVLAVDGEVLADKMIAACN